MKDGKMSINEAAIALRGFAVESLERCGKTCKVIIGNAGRDMMGHRTFTAQSWETIIRQVEKAYGPIPEHIKKACPVVQF